MDSVRIEQRYFPLLVPHPKRAAKWSRVLDYHELRTTGNSPVIGTHYAIEAATAGARGKRIAFISDLHYGDSLLERKLAAAAIKVTREFQPDYLCFGGDMVADSSEMTRIPDLLAEFGACAPVCLAVPGNWERGKEWLPVSYWEELYGKAGFRYLCNRSFEDENFFFYGSDELPHGAPRLPDSCPEGKENVLLVHRPDTAVGLDTLRALEPFRLVLCGHTHGGQVRFPWIGPLYTRSCYGRKFAYGLFRRRNRNTEMIVTSGISSRSFPLRLNCRREVVLVTYIAGAREGASPLP